MLNSQFHSRLPSRTGSIGAKKQKPRNRATLASQCHSDRGIRPGSRPFPSSLAPVNPSGKKEIRRYWSTLVDPPRQIARTLVPLDMRSRTAAMTDSQLRQSCDQTQYRQIESLGLFSVHVRLGRSRRPTFAWRQPTGGNAYSVKSATKRAAEWNWDESAPACEHAERANEAAPDQTVHIRAANACPDERLAMNCRSEVYTDRPPLTIATRFTPHG